MRLFDQVFFILERLQFNMFYVERVFFYNFFFRFKNTIIFVTFFLNNLIN